jgi:hypothetical protein
MNLGYANMLSSLAGNTATTQLNGLNAGMSAAEQAQLAQRTRAQDAFNNSMAYGGAISSTMGVNYQNMFQMDAQLFSQMQQLGIGVGAEGLNQALTNYGLNQEQINQLLAMAKASGSLTTAMISQVKSGSPNGNSGITGGGAAGGIPPAVPPADPSYPGGGLLMGSAPYLPSTPSLTGKGNIVGYRTYRDANGIQQTEPIYG